MPALLIIIGILTVLAVCFFILVPFLAVPTPDPKKAVEIADRFGIEPTWCSIRDYLSFKAFSPGMSRAEVHQVLDKVGPWEISAADDLEHGGWDPDTNQLVYRENVDFTDDDAWVVLGEWGFHYDKNDRLVDQASIDTEQLTYDDCNK